MAWVHVRNVGTRPSQDAKQVMAEVTLFRPDGSSFKYQGRWRQSKEVRDVADWREQIPDRIALPALRSASLDIAFKYEGEADAYAVNTESTHHAPDWRYKPWTLPSGTCFVRVIVTGENVRPVTAWFQLDNSDGGAFAIKPSSEPQERGPKPDRLIAVAASDLFDGGIYTSGFTSLPAASGILPTGEFVSPPTIAGQPAVKPKHRTTHQPTKAEIQKRADWILEHPGRNVARIFLGDSFGPHEAWEQAKAELEAELRDLDRD